MLSQQFEKISTATKHIHLEKLDNEQSISKSPLHSTVLLEGILGP